MWICGEPIEDLILGDDALNLYYIGDKTYSITHGVYNHIPKTTQWFISFKDKVTMFS